LSIFLDVHPEGGGVLGQRHHLHTKMLQHLGQRGLGGIGE
jgi:hypothetical protein